jgi:16S rRNA (cytosine1402-N4)-methyltransferase
MHRPVLYHEIIHALRPRRGGFYVDATLGAGGHAWGILEASSPDGRLLGLDVDPQALRLASEKLAPFSERAILRQVSYTTLHSQLVKLGWEAVDGILLDLGVSSMQVDTRERGFSFLSDAPLDMRFDPEGDVTAASLVNELPEVELAALIWDYGEERRARKVAQAIVKARPLRTTVELANVIARATSSGKPGMHPATRTFQALRIAVNQELDAVRQVLPQAVAALAPGGRLAVISFHSLEDRLVKQYFRQESQDCICPPRQPVCTCGHQASLILVNRQPLVPGADEVVENPRSRSAKLRVVEKLVR